MGTAFDGRLYNADALGALDRLYDQFGSAVVHALDGPFALAARSGSGGLLARDRFGERPLYWRLEDDGAVVFASRLGDLAGRAAGELEPPAGSSHLAGEPLPQALTFVRGVFELPPGHVMDVRDDGRHIHRWWSPPAGGGELVESSAEVRAELRARLTAAVARIPGRRACVLLDGGLESELLAGVAAERFAEPITTVAVGDLDLSDAGAAELVPTLFASLDQPVPDPSVVAFALAADAAAGAGGPLLAAGPSGEAAAAARAADTRAAELHRPCF